jgi:hypothetical protein
MPRLRETLVLEPTSRRSTMSEKSWSGASRNRRPAIDGSGLKESAGTLLEKSCELLNRRANRLPQETLKALHCKALRSTP